jgi:membrane associated rhomboid family serine protease
MFLHAGFWHLAGNLFFFWFFFWMFGNKVENLLGPWLFAATYLLGGFGRDSLLHALNPYSPIPCVGASGAISGIAGCFLVPFPSTRFDLIHYLGYLRLGATETQAGAAVLAWFGEQTVHGLIATAFHVAGGLAYWALFGGFVVGVIIGFLFRTAGGEALRKAEEEVGDEQADDPLQPKRGEVAELKV